MTLYDLHHYGQAAPLPTGAEVEISFGRGWGASSLEQVMNNMKYDFNRFWSRVLRTLFFFCLVHVLHMASYFWCNNNNDVNSDEISDT